MDKSPDAFRTISEVAEDLDIPQHVLRFWETRFTSIKPLKRGGGRRYYRPDDVDLLKGIRQLLYGQGYTIKGVQRILKEDGPRFVQGVGRGEQGPAAPGPDETAPVQSESDLDDEELREAALDPESLADERPGDADRPVEAERLPGGIIPDRALASSAAFAGDEIVRLRAALDELLECERILGTLSSD